MTTLCDAGPFAIEDWDPLPASAKPPAPPQEVIIGPIKIEGLCGAGVTVLPPPQGITTRIDVGNEEMIIVFGEFTSSIPACPIIDVALKNGQEEFEMFKSTGGSFMLRLRNQELSTLAYGLEATATGGSTAEFASIMLVTPSCFITLLDGD